MPPWPNARARAEMTASLVDVAMRPQVWMDRASNPYMGSFGPNITDVSYACVVSSSKQHDYTTRRPVHVKAQCHTAIVSVQQRNGPVGLKMALALQINSTYRENKTVAVGTGN